MSKIETLSAFVAKYGHDELDRMGVDQTDFIDGINNDGEIVEVPVFTRMKQEAPTVVDIFDSWEDDHLPCFGVSVQFANDSETYLFTMWWTDPTLLLTLGQAVNNLDKSIEFVNKLQR